MTDVETANGAFGCLAIVVAGWAVTLLFVWAIAVMLALLKLL